MNESESKPPRSRHRIASAAVMLLCFVVGVAAHYSFVRLRSSDTPIHTMRAKEGGWGIMSEGTWPPSSYPTEAFLEIRHEADRILADVIGPDDALGRYVYVLPEFAGYDIVIHEEPDKRRLTNKEQDEFRDRIRKRMNDIGLQHAPPQTVKAGAEPLLE